MIVQILAGWKSSCHLCAEFAHPQHSIACFGSCLPHGLQPPDGLLRALRARNTAQGQLNSLQAHLRV